MVEAEEQGWPPVSVTPSKQPSATWSPEGVGNQAVAYIFGGGLTRYSLLREQFGNTIETWDVPFDPSVPPLGIQPAEALARVTQVCAHRMFRVAHPEDSDQICCESLCRAKVDVLGFKTKQRDEQYPSPARNPGSQKTLSKSFFFQTHLNKQP